jgi:aminoglycoside phosphotransferase (APT) family kinase protein
VDFASLEPLAGGWSGETFLGRAGDERTVVRIYSRPGGRGDRAAQIDAALLRLVRGLVPVPEVLELRLPDPDAGTPGILVTSFLPGERGDMVLPTLDDAGLATLGARLGTLAADLGGMPMRAAGPFVDESLTIGSFGPDDSLAAYVESQAGHFRHWTTDEMDGLRGIADHGQDLLDTVERRCLVHSDLNPKNLLIDPESLDVTGLLDWEYAHAGHPFTDLGNLLRFDRKPAYVEAALAAYEARRGVSPDVALALGRAADLWALVDLAARRGSNPVADLAHDLLRAVAAARDLNAVPTVAGWTAGGAHA